MITKDVVHENVVGGSSMIWFPLVIAVSEQDMPGIEPGPQLKTSCSLVILVDNCS